MIRTTANASPNLVPIFKFPRNIVLLLFLAQSAVATTGCAATESVVLAFVAAIRSVLIGYAASGTRRFLAHGTFWQPPVASCMRLRPPPD
jgi:hypothetical protein